MIERIPPHNEEAERSVLGAAMLNKEVLFDILEEVKEDDFYNESHKEIFRAIWELYRKNSAVDMLTVCEELESRHRDAHRGGTVHRERQRVREDHRGKGNHAADDPHR